MAARFLFLSFLISLFFSLADMAQGQSAVKRPPNFIVILCDNLGYGDIEPFGSQLHRTPALNRMAQEGRTFTHFYVTAGVCTPSRASLMTGCYAQRVGMHNNPRDGQVLRPVSPYGLHPDEQTIAEVLRSAGYKTGIIGKWHLGDQSDFLPTRQGFDSFFGIPYSDDMIQATGQRLGERVQGNLWPPLPLMQDEIVIEAPVDRDLLTKRYTEKAIAFIEAHQDQPFFLYLPQAMPGSTTQPFSSPEFKGKSRNGPWGDSVEELDWSTGQILNKLVELKLDQSTLVIWTSDNGSPLAREPNDLSRGSNGSLAGRGYTTAEGAFRVPMIAWWPGTIPATSRCSELATTMDLLPTFATWAGVPVNEQPKVDGHDIRELLLNEDAKSPYDAFYYYQLDQLQAVRSGPWKLFLPLKTFDRHPHFRAGKSDKPLLFNVVEDLGCTKNLAEQHPEIVAALNKFAESARADLGDAGTTGKGQRSAGHVENPQPRLLPTTDIQIK
jgi:arylsulfatase A-like enzyme